VTGFFLAPMDDDPFDHALIIGVSHRWRSHRSCAGCRCAMSRPLAPPRTAARRQPRRDAPDSAGIEATPLRGRPKGRALTSAP
jgi:hypothetical protein